MLPTLVLESSPRYGEVDQQIAAKFKKVTVTKKTKKTNPRVGTLKVGSTFDFRPDVVIFNKESFDLSDSDDLAKGVDDILKHSEYAHSRVDAAKSIIHVYVSKKHNALVIVSNIDMANQKLQQSVYSILFMQLDERSNIRKNEPPKILDSVKMQTENLILLARIKDLRAQLQKAESEYKQNQTILHVKQVTSKEQDAFDNQRDPPQSLMGGRIRKPEHRNHVNSGQNKDLNPETVEELDDSDWDLA